MSEAADDHLNWLATQDALDLEDPDPDCVDAYGPYGPWHWHWGVSHRVIEAAHIKTGEFTDAAFKLGDQLKARGVK